uniref:WRKY19-like zinc finger domain-containing protein n=1 Tax=Oryza rufipogon TaxID=4529 RepID=A0A0E0PXW0_ORYRU
MLHRTFLLYQSPNLPSSSILPFPPPIPSHPLPAASCDRSIDRSAPPTRPIRPPTQATSNPSAGGSSPPPPPPLQPSPTVGFSPPQSPPLYRRRSTRHQEGSRTKAGAAYRLRRYLIEHRSECNRSAKVYFMDSFQHGMDADKHIFGERGNMIQLNMCASDGRSVVGQRCQRLGCNNVVEGQTLLCKSHSIGQRCQMLGCPHIVPDGSVLCMSHGGGRPLGEPGSSTVACSKLEISIKYEGESGFRVTQNAGNDLGSAGIYNPDGDVVMCKYQGCSKRAQGNAMYCKIHRGGSKGCMVQGCTKGAHGGTPLCIAHGGGKRCAVTGCPNAACGSSQGLTDRCVRHGGGRRCRFDGCVKGAQGNTDFCIGHGGGRRCKFEGCGKSAQGRSDYCIKHGGGRRCKFQGCATSAKWGMDFCSLHRKSLMSGSNSSHEMLPAPPPKRRAKKTKTAVGPSGLSSDPKSAESVMIKHASNAGHQQQPIHSMKSSPSSGLTASTEGDVAARSHALFGL